MTPLPTPMRLLILGGTSEASALAAALAGREDIALILSLAGRTENPSHRRFPGASAASAASRACANTLLRTH